MDEMYSFTREVSKKEKKLNKRFGEEFVEKYLISMLNFLQDTNFGQTEAMEENWARTIISDKSGLRADQHLIELLYDLQDQVVQRKVL